MLALYKTNNINHNKKRAILTVLTGALRAAEESLASLAGYHPVVDTRRFVPAYLARYDLDLGCK